MNIDKLEKKQYAAYEKFINIELFNDIITFIIDTKCNKKEAWENYKEIEKKVIWIRKRDRNIIRENYKFQYFGELLERYEERIDILGLQIAKRTMAIASQPRSPKPLFVHAPPV